MEVIDEDIHQLWQSQVDFKFGFVPLQKQLLPNPDIGTSKFSGTLLQIHNIVKKSGKQYGALFGPFKENPIEGAHCSPFMTRSKPKSDRRRVIVDLSWPQGPSVNAGIDKFSYLISAFALTFPTVDDITAELKHLGRGPCCTRWMAVGHSAMLRWTQGIMTC